MSGKRVALAMASGAAFVYGQQTAPHVGQADSGVNNTQIITQKQGDRSVVRQDARPGSVFNTQTASVGTPPGLEPNTASQTVEGSANTQSIVMQGGSRNFGIQAASGGSAQNTQTATIFGTGNQIVQTQNGFGNHQTVEQSGNGNSAVQTQRGLNLSGSLRQHGGQTDAQDQSGQ